MPIHSISRCSNTFYASNLEVNWSLKLFAASTMTIGIIQVHTYPIFPKLGTHLHKCSYRVRVR